MSTYIAQRLKSAWDLFRQNRLDEAQAMAATLLRSQPDHPEVVALLAELQLHRNEVARALGMARSAVRAAPENLVARRTLVTVLTAAGERRAALKHIAALGAMGVKDAALAAVHAGTLRELWMYDESVASYEAALREHPDDPALASLLPFTMQYAPGASRGAVFGAHEAFGRALDRRVPPLNRGFRNAPDPDRTLRVGVMSADFYAHSVMYFFDAVLEHSDPGRLRFVAYQTRPQTADSTTARLRRRFESWREVWNEPPGKTAERVLADEIDVLIELNGLTTSIRALETMNGAPAPVTVTYCGYPDTTGVRSVQYRFVDSITDPPGSDEFAVEELVRLDPCFLCYTPPGESPPIDPRPPSARSGHVTFGSFNNIQKMHPGVARAWAGIVKATPGSRLLLKDARLREPSRRQELIEMFEREGLPRARVELLERAPDTTAHLRMYDRLDVALDPFPYNGTTTTCEAAHQGVPTVTVRGDRHASRVGASLLSAMGVPELIAGNLDEYVSTAVQLAGDRDRLGAYRAELRPGMLGSPLCDGPGFAGRFEAALRVAWRRWCHRKSG